MTTLTHKLVEKDALEEHSFDTGLPIEISVDEARAYIRTSDGYLYADLTVEGAR